MGKLYEDIVSRDATYREDNEKILSAYDKMLMNEKKTLGDKLFDKKHEFVHIQYDEYEKKYMVGHSSHKEPKLGMQVIKSNIKSEKEANKIASDLAKKWKAKVIK
jgi:hypothetical protein